MWEISSLGGHKYFTVKTNSVVYSSHPWRIILDAINWVTLSQTYYKGIQEHINRGTKQIYTWNEANSSDDASISFVCKRGNISNSGFIYLSESYIFPDAK